MKKIPGAINRSGGPKSKSGSSISSKNAIKSGIYSRTAFLDGEDPESFELIRQAVIVELQPETLIQAYLAENIVTCIWNKHRLERYCSETVTLLQSKTIEIGEWIVELGLDYQDKIHQAKRLTDELAKKGIAPYEKKLDRVRLVRQLYPKNCPDLDAFKRDYPDVYETFRSLEWRPAELDQLILKNEVSSSDEGFWERKLKSAEEWFLRWIDVFRSDKAVRQAIARILNKRIFNHLIYGHTERASDDVSRALHRALAEYYKERDRYRKDTAIMLDPESREAPEDGGLEEVSDADLAQSDAA